MFYLFTTAIGSRNGKDFEMLMHLHWSKLLHHLLTYLKREVQLVHYVMDTPTAKEQFEQSVRAQSLNHNQVNKHIFIYTSFPTNEQKLCSSLQQHIDCDHIVGWETNHLLVDMAHVVEMAMTSNTGNSSYDGYCKEFLKKINFIYLGYNNFIGGLPDGAPPLVVWNTTKSVQTLIQASKVDNKLYKCVFSQMTEPTLDNSIYDKLYFPFIKKKYSLPSPDSSSIDKCAANCKYFKVKNSDYCSKCQKKCQKKENPKQCYEPGCTTDHLYAYALCQKHENERLKTFMCKYVLANECVCEASMNTEQKKHWYETLNRRTPEQIQKLREAIDNAPPPSPSGSGSSGSSGSGSRSGLSTASLTALALLATLLVIKRNQSSSHRHRRSHTTHRRRPAHIR